MRSQTFLLVILILLMPAGRAFAQADSAAQAAPQKPAEHYGRQLRIAFDVTKPVISLARGNRSSYEAAVDFYVKKEVYAVVEGGFGSAIYEYPDLSYRTNSTFFRAGLDKTLIKRLNGRDWDMAFIGVRYGAAFVNRQEATYAIIDSLWGTTTGSIPSKAFTAHWMEITGGVRVELLPRLMAGWNVRGRFLLSDNAFGDLSPVFIAGYGKGDRTSAFDFNFYVCYAIRWGGRLNEGMKE